MLQLLANQMNLPIPPTQSTPQAAHLMECRAPKESRFFKAAAMAIVPKLIFPALPEDPRIQEWASKTLEFAIREHANRIGSQHR